MLILKLGGLCKKQGIPQRKKERRKGIREEDRFNYDPAIGRH
jgi:hypothetical protein